MKTLHLDTGREMRGGQWQALYLLRELAAAGHDCMLLARPPLLDRARSEGFDARPLRFRDVVRLSRSVDLIHAHDAHAHTLAALVPGPFVVSRRVAFPIRASLASRWKYSRAVRYLAVSKYVRNILIAGGVPAEKIDVVYDGVFVAPAQTAMRSKIVALDSGDPGKGLALIQEAAQRASLEVFFATDLASALQEAALFVYITQSEGLGSGALLAMAAGVPVLASDVGGLPEIVEDGVTGLLTNNSPEQIADNMLRALGDPALLARLGDNARKRVQEGFTTKHMMESTLQVYRKVTG
jgi:glycosyltransferase involved in cell wall biosynthesis